MRECLKTDQEDLIGDWVKMFHLPMMMIITEEKTMKENSSCHLIVWDKVIYFAFWCQNWTGVLKNLALHLVTCYP